MIEGEVIPPRLMVVLPCYNEEAVLRETFRQLSAVILRLVEEGRIRRDSRICFVNDGSGDGTWPVIREICAGSNLAWGINLAHNRGHQNALLAGLSSVKDDCDCAITMDADLQHDVNAIGRFIEKYGQGCDIVYGIRRRRAYEGFVKKIFSTFYYKIMASLGAETIPESADYRLMSRRAIGALMEYREANLFLRGIIPTIGLRHDTVEYEQKERAAGVSKYPFRKMLRFAVTGITSMSDRPLSLIFAAGSGLTGTCAVATGVLLVLKLIGKDIASWLLLAATFCLGTGINLLATGLVGVYLGKVYSEVKGRPRFLIQDFIRDEI